MRTHVNQGSRMWIKDKTAILANLNIVYSLENYDGTYIKLKPKSNQLHIRCISPGKTQPSSDWSDKFKG